MRSQSKIMITLKSELLIWNKNKTDVKGKTFTGSDYIDIVFYAGYNSHSKFKFIITLSTGLLNIYFYR